MDTRYRTLFDISSGKDALVGLSLMRDAEEVLRAWVQDYFLECPEILEEPEYSGNSRGREWEYGGNSLRISGGNSGEQGYFRLRWYVDRDGDDYQRYLGFRLATEGPAVQADALVEVRNRESGHFDEELRLVLDTLLSRYQCSTLDVSLSQNAEQVQMEQVGSFWERLSSNERYLPVVMVSANRSGEVPVDADDLQRDLIGLAEVARCPNEVAWQLGWHSPKLMCYDGQVRVYAPRLSVDDDERNHRVWGFEDVSELGYDRFLQLLRDECEGRIYYPHGRGASRVFRRVRPRVRELKREKMLEEVREEMRAKLSTGQQDFDRLFDEFVAVVENGEDVEDKESWETQSQRSQEGLEDQILKLQVDLEDRTKELQYWKGLALYKESPSSDAVDVPAPVGNEALPSWVRSVADVVEVVKGWQYVRVFERVPKHCGKRSIEDTRSFYDLLEALDRCGEERVSGPLGMPEEDWVKDKIPGFKFSSGESEQTMNMYGDHRQFWDDLNRKDVEMQAHFRVPADLRVHVFWSNEESRWLVGYFGQHLRIFTE